MQVYPQFVQEAFCMQMGPDTITSQQHWQQLQRQDRKRTGPLHIAVSHVAHTYAACIC